MSHTHSSDEESDFKSVSAANYQRLQDKVTKITYADGVADGREKIFQPSFDLGYADGLNTAFELAKLRSFYDTLNSANVSQELQQERQAYENLKLGPATDRTHFKYLEHLTEPLSLVSQKQKCYSDDIKRQCAEALPVTVKLFKSF